MKGFLSPSQIARLEGVDIVSVQRWVAKGHFPNARKVERRIRIPLQDYYAWREGTKVKPRGQRGTDARPRGRTDGPGPRDH